MFIGDLDSAQIGGKLVVTLNSEPGQSSGILSEHSLILLIDGQLLTETNPQAVDLASRLPVLLQENCSLRSVPAIKLGRFLLVSTKHLLDKQRPSSSRGWKMFTYAHKEHNQYKGDSNAGGS